MNEFPKVLIADDEQECIDFVRDALAETPCEVFSAMDGEEALKVAQDQKPQLIILDVQMPKLDGYAVFSKLRTDKDLTYVPVIMLTRIGQRTGIKSNARDMAEYLHSEPEAYIDKPIEPIILKQTVKRLFPVWRSMPILLPVNRSGRGQL